MSFWINVVRVIIARSGPWKINRNSSAVLIAVKKNVEMVLDQELLKKNRFGTVNRPNISPSRYAPTPSVWIYIHPLPPWLAFIRPYIMYDVIWYGVVVWMETHRTRPAERKQLREWDYNKASWHKFVDHFGERSPATKSWKRGTISTNISQTIFGAWLAIYVPRTANPLSRELR